MSDKPIIYNKLVRDKIPEIIEKSGKHYNISTIHSSKFEHFLKLKLIEECHELFKAETIEDMVKESSDVLEILHSLARERRIDFTEIERKMIERRRDKGGFDDRLLLRVVSKEPIDASSVSSRLITPMMLTNRSDETIIDIIKYELQSSSEVSIASAYLSRGMLNLLVDPLMEFSRNGGKIRIITSIMNHFNNPDDIKHIRKIMPNIQVKIFFPPGEDRLDLLYDPPAFHLKCFLFNKSNGENSVIIGSSNLTQSGLSTNYEWNYYSNSEINLPFNISGSSFDMALSEYSSYWDSDSILFNDHFYQSYYPIWSQYNEYQKDFNSSIKNLKPIKIIPNESQEEALKILEKKRSDGIKKTAVIAATGLGKTYLAAFDFKNSEYQNILFLTHRENILNKSRHSFRMILDTDEFGIILSGNSEPRDWAQINRRAISIFGMVQTLSRDDHLLKFDREYFDYIVIDEFHHSEARSYQKVLSYFKPKFLLGLTATPERMDGRDVLRHCDYDVAYESRLFESIEKGWLVPFQYYAIYDQSDYNQVRWTGMGYNEIELDILLKNDTRADLIVKNLEKYLPTYGKPKILAFCSTKDHARYMSMMFNKMGYSSISLLGEDSTDYREESISRLEDENDPLSIICSVDIFGEGVDIPPLTHVLMLRPTLSFTVFLQQLGRGLRRHENKDFLIVLDFVGNYRNSYVSKLVLGGFTSLDNYLSSEDKKQKKIPAGCYVCSDTQVEEIWNEEIEKITKKMDRKVLLEEIYWNMRENIGHPNMLMDFFANPESEDPYPFIKSFGGWLKAKEKFGDLTNYEKTFMGTPGENFLQHIEMELNQVKSYKMVVLKCLMSMGNSDCVWNVEDIALRFRQFYIDHPEYLFDYNDLARYGDPDLFSIKRVMTHIKNMPLNFLSNKESKYFILDRENDTFKLKDEIRSFWNDDKYRILLNDRVNYTLLRYFHLKSNKQEN